MKCPYCDYGKTSVCYPKYLEDGRVIRRRKCKNCGRKFQTVEKPLKEIIILKKDNTKEVFDIHKIERSLEYACAKRPITKERLRHIAREIKYICESGKSNEITSDKIAEEILKRLLIIDKVSYIRYLSVYKRFSDVLEFIKAIQEIK